MQPASRRLVPPTCPLGNVRSCPPCSSPYEPAQSAVHPGRGIAFGIACQVAGMPWTEDCQRAQASVDRRALHSQPGIALCWHRQRNWHPEDFGRLIQSTPAMVRDTQRRCASHKPCMHRATHRQRCSPALLRWIAGEPSKGRNQRRPRTHPAPHPSNDSSSCGGSLHMGAPPCGMHVHASEDCHLPRGHGYPLRGCLHGPAGRTDELNRPTNRRPRTSRVCQGSVAAHARQLTARDGVRLLHGRASAVCLGCCAARSVTRCSARGHAVNIIAPL